MCETDHGNITVAGRFEEAVQISMLHERENNKRYMDGGLRIPLECDPWWTLNLSVSNIHL